MQRVAKCSWPEEISEATSLVLDGPVWLQNRPAVVNSLVELFRKRIDDGMRTVVVQSDGDGSIDRVLARMEAGASVVVGLRYPKGGRGKLRFARRVCDELGIPRSAARGTDAIVPWGYAQVIHTLQEWTRTRGESVAG